MKYTAEEKKKFESAMMQLGDAHTMLARTTMASKDYDPISGLMAKAKVTLFNLLRSDESTPPPADVDVDQLAADAWFEFEYPDGSLYEGVFKGGFLVGYKAAADKR